MAVALPERGRIGAFARVARSACGCGGRCGDCGRAVRALRQQVNEAIEPLRRDKIVRSSLEADVVVPEAPLPVGDLAELFIVAKVSPGDTLSVTRSEFHKCGRCWRLLPDVPEDGALDARCEKVVA